MMERQHSTKGRERLNADHALPTASKEANPSGFRRSNRLGCEHSPYLLQHQFNPVDWFPWGEEAFSKAREEAKPVFLSIGYSTCHWCHVMERESFENETTARFLNEHFVSIKVDREERPDVDRIYMTYVQAMTGQGGWPLNCFLTPDLKPFYAGTYFPPDNRGGRASFLAVLLKIHELWTTHRNDLSESARQMHERLTGALAKEAQPGLVLGERVLRQAGEELKKSYDPAFGGFGGPPKFPQPSIPSYLLRYARRFQDREAAVMVLHTCERMAAGGIHDQLGGGFARYSVDEHWLVPHFEKMLYDNAQLAQLYLEAFLVSGNQRFAEVARDIFRYVLRDMTHPEGGFYSAEDADSEGKEGKFYCWTWDELAQLLSPEEFNVTVRYFGVVREGNFVDHSDPDPLPGQNVLSIANPVLPETDRPLLDAAKERMLRARGGRVRPHLDDKILASWNGLMLGALARASVILGDKAYAVAAERNLAFLKGRLWDSQTKTLYHRWRNGTRDSVQLLEAYALLLCGVLDLYEATLQPEHLGFAVELAESMMRGFHDPEQGGFWQASAGTDDLILRIKEDYDGALPSGNSVAALGLLRLSIITARTEFREAAERIFRLLADRLQTMPQAVPFLLAALDLFVEEPLRLVITGPAEDQAARDLVRAAHSVYSPNKVVMGNQGAVEPFAAELTARENRPTAHLCTGRACLAPTGDAQELTTLLRGTTAGRQG